MWRVDEQHGNLYGAWERMGSPRYLTKEQQQLLMKQSDLRHPEALNAVGGEFKIEVPGPGLAVIEVR